MTNEKQLDSVRTLIINENKCGSLMLCGLNHGWGKKDEQHKAEGTNRMDKYKSFFSDKAVNKSDFRDKIVKWFDLWGYPLENTDAGVFEKSITQTNWLQSASSGMKDNEEKTFIDSSDDFINTCSELKPKLILFFGQELIKAFTSEQMSDKVEDIFGKKQGKCHPQQKDVVHNGKNRIRFTFFFQSYENLEIVAMPHATGAIGVADDYIKSFKPEMKEIIDSWWCNHKKLIG